MKRVSSLIFTLLLLGILIVPCNADSYNDGIEAYRNNNFEAAEYYFRDSVRISPVNARYCYYLAITLVQLGKIQEATSYYNKVIQLAPGSDAADKARKGLALLYNKSSLASSEKKNGNAMISVLDPNTAAKKVSIPLTSSGNAIIVPNVVINDRLKANFILDTGATFTSISRQTAMQLGINLNNAQTVNLKTANGIIQVSKIRLKTINIAGIVANDVEVTIHDLPASKNITGLLGLSFLEQFTVTIDKKNNRITLESM